MTVAALALAVIALGLAVWSALGKKTVVRETYTQGSIHDLQLPPGWKNVLTSELSMVARNVAAMHSDLLTQSVKNTVAVNNTQQALLALYNYLTKGQTVGSDPGDNARDNIENRSGETG